MQVANRLSVLRIAQRLTQAQVAKTLGVDPSTVYRWEMREVGIPDTRKVELAALFGVSVGHLMCWPHEDNGGNGKSASDVAA